MVKKKPSRSQVHPIGNSIDRSIYGDESNVSRIYIRTIIRLRPKYGSLRNEICLTRSMTHMLKILSLPTKARKLNNFSDREGPTQSQFISSRRVKCKTCSQTQVALLLSIVEGVLETLGVTILNTTLNLKTVKSELLLQEPEKSLNEYI